MQRIRESLGLAKPEPAASAANTDNDQDDKTLSWHQLLSIIVNMGHR